ncbi:MAG: hypothetical protein ACKV2V_01090 [Blastocatellia bacterium]
MKNKLPAIMTVLLMLAGLLFLTQRERLSGLSVSSLTRTSDEPAGPEEVIWRMSDAARAGDVRAYADCFSGQLHQRLQKTMAEMGEDAFRQYLQKMNNDITGIAVSDEELSGAETAKLRVEFVYRGRNEAQIHHFRMAGGQWKIEATDDPENVRALVPYGTAVGQQPEAGDGAKPAADK